MIKPTSMSGVTCTLVLAGALALSQASCSSDSPQSLIASGKQFVAKKDPRSAVIQFKSALQLDPQSVEARYLLGQAMLDSEDPTGAAVELAKAFDQKYDPNKVLPSLARANGAAIGIHHPPSPAQPAPLGSC